MKRRLPTKQPEMRKSVDTQRSARPRSAPSVITGWARDGDATQRPEFVSGHRSPAPYKARKGFSRGFR
jgi:hypothetical protein